MHVLLVEDDSSFGYILSEYLTMKSFKTIWVKGEKAASEKLQTAQFDLAILDVGLSDGNGFSLAESLKVICPETPFIFLTARDFKIDQLKGYRLGADEYVTKPIDEEVLVAKIEAIMSRREQQNLVQLRFSNINLQYKEQLLEVGTNKYRLTTRENDLLKRLMERQGKLVSRKELLTALWGSTDEFSRKSMDVFISRLRKYLQEGSSVRIRNVHGKGFVLE
ncbi:response regulator transcription factor [Fulvivirga sp. 29W222]|uniref:Response regulator transcription factor n=1 Tax=Fulvivirga marina TaxID=2494733 RepID=A0A937FZN1_9BACT|nr:response regulator transcription factor [Fulvivirga marina]MBL6447952.1 response regulator transcription factor [Fulvivirga marina]